MIDQFISKARRTVRQMRDSGSAQSIEGQPGADGQQNQEPMGDGGAGERRTANTAVLSTTNTFAATLVEDGHLAHAQDTFGCDVPVEALGDVPFRRDLTRIERTLPLLEPDLEEAMLRLTKEADYILAPTTVGTGYIAYRWADLGRQFNDTIDWVLTSEKTPKPETYAQNAILAGVGHGMLEPPVIMCDHRAGEIPFEKVAPETAHALIANIHTDVTNRSVGYWTVHYDHIPTGGLSDMRIAEAVRDVIDEAEPWFSKEFWCPWAEQDLSVPVGEAQNSFVIVPDGIELGLTEHVRVIRMPTVSGVHVLNFWPVDDSWVEEHIRRGGVEFVDSKIRDENSRISTVWESHAAPRDPIDEWERLRENYIDPRLPEP